MLTKQEVIDAISPITDPEINIGVVDLGLIYDAIISDDGKVTVNMTLTTPACPYGPILMNTIKETVLGLDGVSSVEVELVWEPAWNPTDMASDYAKDILGIW